MIVIQHVLVSDEVIEEQFACQLDACKGACCWEGDFGAPLLDEEIELLEKDQDKILPYLPKNSQQYLANKKGYKFFTGMQENGTALHQNGACIYLTFDNNIAMCGIEKAWKDGQTTFRKPISCHLYPIRVERSKKTSFEAMNYDRWDICSAACSNGAKKKIKVYEFAKEAIIRAYGDSFYEALDAAANRDRSKDGQ